MRRDGFTLVEMVVVIAITAIISAAVAVFIKLPVQGYTDAARRAEMTDIADTALRRIGRDLRLALPNSVRVDSGTAIEILLTRSGGRYRTEGPGDVLDFTTADTRFEQLGPFASGAGQTIVPNADRVVVYNLGIAGADAYAGDNTALITATDNTVPAAPTISFAAKQFPFESPGQRFQVIEGPVSYVCAGGNLTRYWGYAIQATQPTAAALPGLAGVQSALLATNASCSFDYSPGVTARAGLVAMTLVVTEAGESVRLYHEVHVNNVP
jgi:MSHA biogenesis protein MshO